MKNKTSVLIHYNKDVVDAPYIGGVAIGEGISKEVRSLANQYAVPVVKNSTLVNSLKDKQEHDLIDEDLYEDIARAFVCDIV